ETSRPHGQGVIGAAWNEHHKPWGQRTCRRRPAGTPSCWASNRTSPARPPVVGRATSSSASATTSTSWASSTSASPRLSLPQALAERSSTGTSTRWPEPWTNWSQWVPSNSGCSPSAGPGFRHRLGRQARRQHVDEEAADELLRRERHHLDTFRSVDPIV